MQRDMKVGMAVGVALIGIVGALFFRREPETRQADNPPPLKNTEEIDRRIGEKGKMPYMSGVEDSPEHSAPVPPPQSAATKSKSRGEHRDAAGAQSKDGDGRDPEVASRKTGTPPDPIQSRKDEAADNIPAHNREWEPAGSAGLGNKKGGGTQRSTPAASAGTPGRSHVIQAGETLSGLASRYLGSSGRFREIYEANRNVLKSPDDLPDGVTIVIPDGGKPRDSQKLAPGSAGAGSTAAGGSGAGHSGLKAHRTSVRSADFETDESPVAAPPKNDAPREKLRFAPVHRGPFSAGRAPAQSGSSRSERAPGRKPDTSRLDRIEDEEP